MPNMNHEQRVTGKNASVKNDRKAPGMRLGTIQDWRQASGKQVRTSGRHGHAVRDGR